MDGMDVSGDAKAGWIISMHDGTCFHAMTTFAGTKAAAVKEALASWKTKFGSAFSMVVADVKEDVAEVEAMVEKEVEAIKDLAKKPDKTS